MDAFTNKGLTVLIGIDELGNLHMISKFDLLFYSLVCIKKSHTSYISLKILVTP